MFPKRDIAADDLARYREQGYLVIRQAINASELEPVYSAVESLRTLPQVTPENLRCRFHLHPTTGDSLLEALDPVTDLSAPIKALALNPGITGILSKIFEAEPRLFKDKLILKPSGARGYALHQDYIHWPLFPRSFTTVVVALDASRRDNGCIEVFPGLHKDGSFAPLDGDYHDLPDAVIAGVEPVALELDSGDIAIFGCFLPHRSAPNQSGKPRRQLYFSYNAVHDGGDLRDFHYQYFQRWIRRRYGEYGAADLHFR